MPGDVLYYPLVMAERLKNPGMLAVEDRRGPPWVGETIPVIHGGIKFCRFTSTVAGFRAFALDFQRRATLLGEISVRQAYAAYAPNALPIYLVTAARRCEVSLDTVLDPRRYSDAVPLLWTLAGHVTLGSLWRLEDAEAGWREAWRFS